MSDHELEHRSVASDRAEIMDNWRAQVRGMDEGDAEMIAAQFLPGSQVVRASGVEQPLRQWLEHLTRGHVVYGRLVERSVHVTLEGDAAHLEARLDTGVDPDGVSHGVRLLSSLDYQHTPDGWFCTAADLGTAPPPQDAAADGQENDRG